MEEFNKVFEKNRNPSDGRTTLDVGRERFYDKMVQDRQDEILAIVH